jgi:hypothetical protein
MGEDTGLAVGLEEAPVAEEIPFDTEIPETTEEGAPAEGEGEQAAPIGAEPDAPAIKDGILNEATKAHLDALKVTDPKLAKALRDALFSNDRYAKAIPGGIKEYQALTKALEPVGGVEGLQQTLQQVDYFNGIDAAFTAADPKFVEALTDTPEGSEAFQRLAPAMIEKFKALNPDSPFQIPADFHRACALAELGQREAAVKIWSFIAARYPKHELAAEAAALCR